MLPESLVPSETIPLHLIATEQGDTIRELRNLDPIVTAATFGALLATPDLQANCLRLEILVHLALVYCAGRKPPSRGFVMRAFERLGQGFCGHAEDPSEDVFVTNVHTAGGNYRVFQGIRESPGFCLQRLLDVIQTMPDGQPFDGIRSAVEALLRLSEATVTRAQLSGNCLGQEFPLEGIPRWVADRLPAWRAVVRFSEGDLDELQLPLPTLSEFVFHPDENLLCVESRHGHSALERRPIVVKAGSVYVLLPTAVATAITRFVVERVLARGLGERFERVLAREVADALSKTPLIAKRAIAHVPFQQFEGGWLGRFMAEVDRGRYVHTLLFVDGLQGFAETGLAGANSAPEALGVCIDDYLRHAAAEAKTRPGFREALLLIVVAGLGRTVRFPLRTDLPPGWWVEMISAADFVTISHLRRFDWAAVWKLLESRRAIEDQGIHLVNINGFLNLAAWADELDGHLVPTNSKHSDVSDGPIGLVCVRQNALRKARHAFLTEYASRRVLDIDGRWVLVQKQGTSFFPEDESAPLFVSEEDLERGELKSVYIGRSRPWWVQISATEGSSRAAIYDYWQMLCIWLRRAAPLLDDVYGRLLAGPVLFDIRFGKLVLSSRERTKQLDESELRALIHITANAGSPRIVIRISDGFDDAFRRPENTAEQLIVEAMVNGAALADGEHNPTKAASLVASICPNPHARHVHAFEAHNFRDFFAEQLNRKPTIIDCFDCAASRIGLGWKARARGASAEISGTQECTAFLNDTVQAVMTEMCRALKQFGRRDFASAVLHNYELAAHDRERWRRTAQANLALHRDQAATMEVIMRHESELNACFVASRILLEAANCECPTEGQYELGKIDLSGLMAKASMVFHLGGWSDAIHWGAVEPHISINMSGDVQLHQRFFDAVYEPFGRVGTESRVSDAVASYRDLYAPPESITDASAILNAVFLAAWAAEFSISFDGMRRFLDKIEDVALKRVQPVLTFKRSEILQMLVHTARLSHSEAEIALSAFSLSPRSRWHDAPAGFQGRDWHPWRFRRRLSILRRTLLQLDSDQDPLLMIAPGLAREGFAYTVNGFYSGEFPDWQARSPEMRRWLGSANHRHRQAFNAEVATRLRELGWQAEQEVKLTKLLNESLTKDYGDVDVLAWNPDSRRILLIECKDVQYRKTLGEIAEQLADYRGELKTDGKPDDLKKHLDRVGLLQAHSQRVAEYLNLGAPIQLEGHLVFKHPVPMRFAWEHMAGKIHLSLFDDLAQL